MKKNSPLYIFLMFSIGVVFFTGTAYGFAADSSENRWQVLSSQDGVTIFFDTDTICFADGNENQIRFWQKCAFNSSAATKFAALLNFSDENLQVSYFLEDRIFDIKNHTKAIYELDAYDANNILIETNRPATKIWETITPDSDSDKICLAIMTYANSHKQQLLENENMTGSKGGFQNE